MTPAQRAATAKATLNRTICMALLASSGSEGGAVELAEFLHRRIVVDRARLRPDEAAVQVEHPAVEGGPAPELPGVLDDARLAEVVDLLDDVQLDHAVEARAVVEQRELAPEVLLRVLQRAQPVVD